MTLSLSFTNMDVDISVASIPPCCKAGRHVNLFDGEGMISNRSNGTQVRFIDVEGVYFLQLNIKAPKSSSVSTLGFTWQGPQTTRVRSCTLSDRQHNVVSENLP